VVEDVKFKVNGRDYICTEWSAVEGLKKGLYILKILAPFLESLPEVYKAIKDSQSQPAGKESPETEDRIQAEQIVVCIKAFVNAKDIDPQLITSVMLGLCEGVIAIHPGPGGNVEVTADYFNNYKEDFFGVVANAARIQLAPFFKGSGDLFRVKIGSTA